MSKFDIGARRSMAEVAASVEQSGKTIDGQTITRTEQEKQPVKKCSISLPKTTYAMIKDVAAANNWPLSRAIAAACDLYTEQPSVQERVGKYKEYLATVG